VLGTGSFATVWLALDEVLDRRVAVKILADNWSQNHDVRRRFLAEARVLLTVESPRIVRGFHLGETPAGQPYLVMAWADRGTLGDRIEQRRSEGRTFTVGEVVAIAGEIAAALADVHRSGHLHRDVKPTNVLLRSSSTAPGIAGLAGDEAVVLADFGLARGLDMTSLTLVAGSPGYVAPEQAAGLVQLDRRADLYSLGRIMLELLTGDPGGRATTMAGAANETIDAAAELAEVAGRGEDVPADLVDLVARLLADDPDDRPATADEVVAALSALGGAPPQPPSPPSPPDVPGPPPPSPRPAPGGAGARRRGLVVVAAGAVVVLAVVGLAIALGRGGGGDAGGATTTPADTAGVVDPAAPSSAPEPTASTAVDAPATVEVVDPPGSTAPPAELVVDTISFVDTFDDDPDRTRGVSAETRAEFFERMVVDNAGWEHTAPEPALATAGDDTPVQVVFHDGARTATLVMTVKGRSLDERDRVTAWEITYT